MKLSDYLRHHQIPRSAFAEKIGVDVASVGRYVTGERRPTWPVLRLIKTVTDGQVTADDFMDPPESVDVKTENSGADCR